MLEKDEKDIEVDCQSDSFVTAFKSVTTGEISESYYGDLDNN